MGEDFAGEDSKDVLHDRIDETHLLESKAELVLLKEMVCV
jgi:hypothetical protein